MRLVLLRYSVNLLSLFLENVGLLLLMSIAAMQLGSSEWPVSILFGCLGKPRECSVFSMNWSRYCKYAASCSWVVTTIMTLTLCVALGQPAVAQEEISAWSYYAYPPFALEDGGGLGPEFVDLLNEVAKGRFVFSLEVLPRKRIDLRLSVKDPGIVLFVSPEWMLLPKDHISVWSGPLFRDQNGVLFSGLAEQEYAGPESLYGKRLGGVIGRRYKGLDEAVAKGRIIRHDALSEEINVLKLAERRIDVMTAPESVLRYLVAHLGVEDKVHFSSAPLFRYTRHILISNISPEARAFLIKFVQDLPGNPGWIKLKEKYHLQ